MFQGLNIVFLVVLFSGLGLAFLGFFVQIFRIMFCHRRPLSFPDERDERGRKMTELSETETDGNHTRKGDTELASTRNILQEGNKDLSAEIQEEQKDESCRQHTLV
jgi:hypothetical protein